MLTVLFYTEKSLQFNWPTGLGLKPISRSPSKKTSLPELYRSVWGVYVWVGCVCVCGGCVGGGVCVCMHVCMYVCMCVCVGVWCGRVAGVHHGHWQTRRLWGAMEWVGAHV